MDLFNLQIMRSRAPGTRNLDFYTDRFDALFDSMYFNASKTLESGTQMGRKEIQQLVAGKLLALEVLHQGQVHN